MAFTDSNVISSTVASAAETEIGQLAVPAGRVYSLTGIYGGHTSGGEYSVKIDTYVSLQGTFLQNAPTGIAGSENGARPYPINIEAIGPCTITGYVTNSNATTGKASIMIQYVNSGPGASN